MFNSKRIEKLEKDIESARRSFSELRDLLGIEIKKTVEHDYWTGKDRIVQQYAFKSKKDKKTNKK